MQGAQTRLKISAEDQALIEELMAALGVAERQAYQRWQKGKLLPEDTIKWLQKEHHLTSAQAESVFKRVEQWCSMDEESHRWQLTQAETRLGRTEQKIQRLDAEQASLQKAGSFAKPNRLARLREQRFHAFRALTRQQSQKSEIEEKLRTQSYGRVFGSRQLLGQRTRLDSVDSPWKDESAWRQEWHRRRQGLIWMSGQASDTCGNESIQWAPETQTLAIRLTDLQAQRRLQAEAERLGVPVAKVPNKMSFKRLVLRDVDLAPALKGQLSQAQALNQPIAISIQFKPVPRSTRHQDQLKQQLRSFSRGPGRHGHGSQRVWPTPRAERQSKAAKKKNIEAKAAMLKAASTQAELGLYLHASFELPKAIPITSRHRGVLGVDINAWGVAWCITTHDGNVLKDPEGRALKGNLPLDLKGLTSNQAKARVLQVTQQLIALAETHQVALAHEALDFTRAKVSMREKGAGYSSMLSGLKTSGFEKAIRARGAKRGIPVHAVNPAWTSISGFAKYGLRNGLSIDQAAALAIARKGLLGKEPDSFAQPVPTHNKDNKKLNPKFRRALQAKRDSYVLNHEESVSFAQPVPRLLQRKHSGPTLAWKDVGRELGWDRRTWVKTLCSLPSQSSGTPSAARPPGRTVSRSRIAGKLPKGTLASPSRPGVPGRVLGESVSTDLPNG